MRIRYSVNDHYVMQRDDSMMQRDDSTMQRGDNNSVYSKRGRRYPQRCLNIMLEIDIVSTV